MNKLFHMRDNIIIMFLTAYIRFSFAMLLVGSRLGLWYQVRLQLLFNNLFLFFKMKPKKRRKNNIFFCVCILLTVVDMISNASVEHNAGSGASFDDYVDVSTRNGINSIIFCSIHVVSACFSSLENLISS